MVSGVRTGRRGTRKESQFVKTAELVLNEEQWNQKKANGKTGCYCANTPQYSSKGAAIKHGGVGRELKAFRRHGRSTNSKVRNEGANAWERGAGGLTEGPQFCYFKRGVLGWQ